MTEQALTLIAKDRFPLAATGFGLEDGKPILLALGATGVPRGFYGKWARFHADRGIGVLTFDYRGIGDSRPSDGLRGFQATMTDWAKLDAQAAIDWIKSHYPRSPLWVMGHSFGGQALALTEGNPAFERVLMVGVQSGYWRHFRPWQRPFMAFLWYVLLPLSTRLLGYFPSRALGLGEDLPAGVALEWARWCRHPLYLMSTFGPAQSNRFSEIRCPILYYSITDDGFASIDSCLELIRFLPQERLKVRRIDPQDFRMRSIGHFGFFRDSFRYTLWPETLQWLNAKS